MLRGKAHGEWLPFAPISYNLDLMQPTKQPEASPSKVIEQASSVQERARWRAENQVAIDYHDAFVEKHGLFGDEFRQF